MDFFDFPESLVVSALDGSLNCDDVVLEMFLGHKFK